MSYNICGVYPGGYVTIECTDGISGNDCAGYTCVERGLLRLNPNRTGWFRP